MGSPPRVGRFPFSYPVAAAQTSAWMTRASPGASVPRVRILVIGSGGVGAAAAAIARRRGFFERLVLADIDPARADREAARLGDDRIAAVQLDASDEAAIVELARA